MKYLHKLLKALNRRYEITQLSSTTRSQSDTKTTEVENLGLAVKLTRTARGTQSEGGRGRG